MTHTRRRLAFDPRFVVGVALVAASVAGVVTLVTAADETTEVLSAGETLSPGDRVQRDEFVVLDVRLAGSTARYLAPGDVPEDGIVVTRSVGEGELVPLDAVGSTDGLRLAALVLDVDGVLAASVQPGTTVDVWAARGIEGGGFGAPTVIASGVTVVRVVEAKSAMAGDRATAVEVLVPTSRVARVLEAKANVDAVSIVPAAIPVR